MRKRCKLPFSALLFFTMMLCNTVVEAKVTKEFIELNQLRPTQFAIGLSNALDMEKRTFQSWVQELHEHIYGADKSKILSIDQMVTYWSSYHEYLQKRADKAPVEAMFFKGNYYQTDGHHRTRLFLAGQERLESLYRLDLDTFCQNVRPLVQNLTIKVEIPINCNHLHIEQINLPKIKIAVLANNELSILEKRAFYLSMFMKGKILLPLKMRNSTHLLIDEILKLDDLIMSNKNENKKELKEIKEKKIIEVLKIIKTHIPKNFYQIKDYPLRSLVGNAFYNTSIISNFLEDYVEFYFAEKLLEVNNTDEIEPQHKFTENEAHDLESCSEESCSIKGTEERLIQKTRYIIFNSKTLWKWFNEHVRIGQQANAETMLQNAKSKYELQSNPNKFPAQIKKQLSYDLGRYTPPKNAISPRECNNNSGKNDCHPFLRTLSNQNIVRVGHEVKEQLDKSSKNDPIKKTTSEKILNEDMQKIFKDQISAIKKAKGIIN